MAHRVLESELNTPESSNHSVASSREGSPRFRRTLWIFPAVVILSIVLLRWGGYLLVAIDALPQQVDAAVVLQGSILGEKARVAGAVALLQQGTVARLLLSIPKETYWGQPVAPIAYRYIENRYGPEVAGRVEFCGSGEEVDSTQAEATVLAECIRERGWHTIAVVTSDYHTRRAGIIWRRMLRASGSSVQVWMDGVTDPEFHVTGWWRARRSAKTWAAEMTKLLWSFGEFTLQKLHAVHASFMLSPIAVA